MGCELWLVALKMIEGEIQLIAGALLIFGHLLANALDRSATDTCVFRDGANGRASYPHLLMLPRSGIREFGGPERAGLARRSAA